MAMKTVICLSLIVLNNFLRTCVKKKIVPHHPKASPLVTAYNMKDPEHKNQTMVMNA